ncbi:MAG: rhodanese-like domain-containing protein [Candidatus Bathyarchaeota archaeon]|nr:rhodanese-like domain-containing protein [Candidatus Bathyarchaeota archaeon]
MNNTIRKKIVGFLLMATLILSFVATVQSFAIAQEPSDVTDVTAEQAHELINRHSSNILILDVRNKTEYKFAHLYNALQIPCHVLEGLIHYYEAVQNATIIDWRIGELMEHVDDPVIVYCQGGSRSAVAANILSENGFSEVYNIVGGIEAWLQADLPIYNTAHDITVDRNRITIDPWTTFSCACGTPCGSNEDVIQNRTLDIIEQTENFTQGILSFEYNGTMYEHTVSATTIWNYADSDHKSNVTASFELLQSTGGTVNIQEYVLEYQIQTCAYNFSVTSILQPLDANTYNASATMVRFVPVGKNEFLSIERVNFTSSVTLSGLYSSLARVCKNLAHTYQRDGIKHNDDILKGLADSYGHMANELKSLSKLVHIEFRNYDREIIQSIALVTDDYCWACMLVCGLLINVVTCGPLDFLLVPAICVAAGIGTVGIAGVACVIVAGVLIGALCEGGIALGCEWVCHELHYCGINYIEYITCAAPYGYGAVYNEQYMTGEPDGWGAAIVGYYWGDGGVIAGQLTQMSSGGMYIRLHSADYTSLWVYTSLDNQDWECIGFDVVPPIYGYDNIYALNVDPYLYVAVAAMAGSSVCAIEIDSISANY